uniref:uncharacterized protein n=1 Tax=Myxine glutinosa TaxID=7769 RepID=UPI0035900DF4
MGEFRDYVWVLGVRVGQVVRWCRKQTRTFSLMMHHVAAEDAGMYECKIKLQSGKENISSRFQVHVTTGQDDSKSSSSDRTSPSTCSTVSPSTNSTKINEDYQGPYFIPFLCVCVIMVVLMFFCIFSIVKIVQLQRDSTDRCKPQGDTDQTDPLSPKPTEPIYLAAERSDVVESPYSSLNPTRPVLPAAPVLPTRPVLPSAPVLPTRPVLPSSRSKIQRL